MTGFFGLLIVAILATFAIFHTPDDDEIADETPAKIKQQLNLLWNDSSKSFKNKHLLRAEKALLMILKLDHGNAKAYNRLGMLYAKQKNFSDAVECFEIAQSLEPSASNLHNVGLIYYETGELEKAAQATEQALLIDDTVAVRHIMYAKVQEKLGNHKLVIDHLRRAVELDPTTQNMTLLSDAYKQAGKDEISQKIEKKIAKLDGKKLTIHGRLKK